MPLGVHLSLFVSLHGIQFWFCFWPTNFEYCAHLTLLCNNAWVLFKLNWLHSSISTKHLWHQVILHYSPLSHIVAHGSILLNILAHKRFVATNSDERNCKKHENKARYTATEVACGWAGAIFEVTRPFGQEQRVKKNEIIRKSYVTDRLTDGQSGL